MYCLKTESKIDIYEKLERYAQFFKLSLMCFQRSCVYLSWWWIDIEISNYKNSNIENSNVQCTGNWFNYATIMKTLEGAMEVWESFYSKNGRDGQYWLCDDSIRRETLSYYDVKWVSECCC